MLADASDIIIDIGSRTGGGAETKRGVSCSKVIFILKVTESFPVRVFAGKRGTLIRASRSFWSVANFNTVSKAVKLQKGCAFLGFLSQEGIINL